MKRLAVLILFVLSLVPASPAFAGQPIDIQGTDTGFVTGIDCTDIGNSGHYKLTLRSYSALTGDLSGTATFTTQIIGLRPCDGSVPLGSVVERGHYTGTFTGTVNGRQGTFEMSGNFQSTGDFTAKNEIVISHGTGELAGIHGVLFEEGPFCETCSAPLSYTGQIQFSP
jgi:hypothetical protein